jgi:hypothetical protein
MGVEHGVIPDGQMTASTIYSSDFPAHFGRVNIDAGTYKTWCAESGDKEPYLQVDLGHIRTICGVGTQGRGKYDAVDYFSWITSYSVQLSNDSSTWVDFQQNGWTKACTARYDSD